MDYFVVPPRNDAKRRKTKRRIIKLNKMDTDSIIILLMGFLAIGVAIFGKLRPDIIFRLWPGVEVSPEGQRFGVVGLLLFGVMVIIIALAMGIPQWQEFASDIAIGAVMVITAAMLFSFWKIILSSNEKFRVVGFVMVLLLSLLLIGFGVYYITL